MKIIVAVTTLMSLAFTQQGGWFQQQQETGLCLGPMGSCPNRRQRYGVYCRLGPDGQLKFFQNYCKACQAGCEQWVFKKTP